MKIYAVHKKVPYESDNILFVTKDVNLAWVHADNLNSSRDEYRQDVEYHVKEYELEQPVESNIYSIEEEKVFGL